MSDSQKIYVANLKASPKFGDDLISGAICVNDFLALLEQEDVKKLIYEYEGDDYLNIKVVKMKEEGKFGKTHYIEIDTWVPEGKVGSRASTKKSITKKKATTSKAKEEATA